ncbi:MAG: class I SAM-dependent methyltransferase [Endomicrobiaceae bacterium]|nr:class I SAM-dependent methyltransferase [Endomicrobiaceae bacterium]
MKDNTKLFYNLTAKQTADEWYSNDLLMPSIKEFVSLFGESPKILDLGCGTGHESMRLSSIGAKVTGIDFSEECIKTAKQRCKECSFKLMNFEYIDTKLGNFDGIFACASLIHISDKFFEPLIKKIVKILNKNGYFLMIVQDGTGINEKWSNFEIDGENVRRTLYCRNKEFILKASENAGLKFIKEGYLDNSLYEQNWRSYLFMKIL